LCAASAAFLSSRGRSDKAVAQHQAKRAGKEPSCQA